MHRARVVSQASSSSSPPSRVRRAFTAHGIHPRYRPTSGAADACEGARGASSRSARRRTAFVATVWTVWTRCRDDRRGEGRRRGTRARGTWWWAEADEATGFAERSGDVDALARSPAVTDGGYDGVSYDWEYPTNDDEWERTGGC